MLPIRIKACSESDLRMLGNLARNIQRVLPVTQADIDAAAALGKGWVVWKVFEVSDPLDNLRGGTQLIIRQNSIQPGQNVRRVIFVARPGGQTVVIRGTDYIALPDAITDSLSYVKAFGGTEQNGTPTPTVPVDIISNNGALKIRHQSGLPLGYTLLDYIETTVGTEYIVPQVTGNARWVITAQTNAVKGSSQSLITSTNSASGGSWYGEFTATGHWDIKSGGTNIASTTKTTADLTFDSNGVSGTIGSTSVSREIAVTHGNWRIFGAGSGIGPYIGKLFSAKVYQGGVLVRNMIPAKNSSNIVGMYDLVSGQFFTNQGTGTITAGTAVSDPIEIYTDGTVETIKDSLNNTATAEMLLSVDTYTDQQEVISGSVARKCGAVVLDSSLVWTYDSTYGRVNATIPNLWGSTVARTIPGFCTHFKWLSHQESMSSITPGQCYSAGANRIFLHISQTSAAAFSAWLDAQRDAGTPVIIVFPLENATTESVTGQTLQVQDGDNTLEITQASLTGLELEAEYEKEVE